MSESVAQRLKSLPDEGASRQLRFLFESILADLGVLRTPTVAGVTDISTILTGTFPRSDHGVCVGTSDAAKVKTVLGVIQVLGVPIACASAETAFTATTHDITGGSSNSFILSVAADGTTFTLTMGTEAVGTTPGAVGAVPSNGAALGKVVIYSAAAGFNASTTLLSAADLTVTYTSYSPYDVFPGEDTLTAVSPVALTITA